MKIVTIVPGTGGQFYCQNCMRDAGLVRALRTLKHDIVMMPMYLPLGVDDPKPTGDVPVFYGAVNCYLKQKIPAFRHLPLWAEQIIDSPPVLRWAARMSGTTEARGLEEMTISVLKGEDGNQADELERLVAWMKTESPPDVVHLSNALLLGLAPRIRRELGCAVVCSLQDELPWIETMDPEALERVRLLMVEKAKSVDVFLPVSAYYSSRVWAWMASPELVMHVTPVGIDPDGYRMAQHKPDALKIGFLSRTGASQGLGILADAFIKLKRCPAFGGLRLGISGGTPPQDRRFVRNLKRKLQRAGVLDMVEFEDDFHREHRQAFLESLSVLSVPAPGGDAFGLYLVEAMASGVPVVQPREGAAIELITASGGGILCESGETDALVEVLDALLRDKNRRRKLGRQGHDYVMAHLTNSKLAVRVVEVYEQAVLRRQRN